MLSKLQIQKYPKKLLIMRQTHPLRQFMNKKLVFHDYEHHWLEFLEIKEVYLGDKFVSELLFSCNRNEVKKFLIEKMENNDNLKLCYGYTIDRLDELLNNMINYLPFALKELRKSKDNKDIGFILDLEFDPKNYIEPVDTWTTNIRKDGSAGLCGSLYSYPILFLNCIVNKKTVDKYGINGFVGLLLLYVRPQIITKGLNPLETIIKKKIGNEIKKFYKEEIKDKLELEEDTFIEKIQKWINFLETKLKKYDLNNFINEIMSYVPRCVEITFAHVNTHYSNGIKNRLFIYNEPNFENIKELAIKQIIVRFHQKKSIEDWIKLLNDFLELDIALQINIITSYLDRDIAKTFFGNSYDNSKKFICFKKTWYCTTNPYEPFIERIEVYNQDGSKDEKNSYNIF